MTESMGDLEPLVTRCPHCSTRFRVSEAQLQVAKGRVRCGACLTVFVGIDHLQWDLEQDVALAHPNESIDQLLGEIDEFELEEIKLPAAAASVVPVEEIADSTSSSHLLNDFSPDVDTPQSVEVIEQAIEVEDKTVEVEPDRRDSVSNEPDLPTTQTQLEPASIEVELPVDPFDQLSYETAREELITEPAAFSKFVEAEMPDTSLSPGDFQPDPEVEYAAPAELRTPALPKRPISDPGTAPTLMRPRVAGDLAPEVLEVPPRSRFQRWRWALFVIAFVLIAVQVVWYLLPSWIANPEQRWLPEQVCKIAGCKLEPLRDLSQLLLTNVVVRAHPERPEVRQIDLLLVNSGTFDQAFPDIEITFSTPAGDRVAWKRFTPAQYLGGDMKDATAIPKKTPVRISLEVTDPGTLAYSYEITLK
jgi:predicted Zn finger-like uncharacterized protein